MSEINTLQERLNQRAERNLEAKLNAITSQLTALSETLPQENKYFFIKDSGEGKTVKIWYYQLFEAIQSHFKTSLLPAYIEVETQAFLAQVDSIQDIVTNQ